MPAYSLRAAQEWRLARLEIRQTKAVRMCGNNGGKRPKKWNPKEEPKSTQKINITQKRLLLKGAIINLESTNANTLFLSARALKEKSLALHAQAKVDLLLGTLLKREDVEREVFAAARQFRDQLLNLPKRISPDLFEQKNPSELEKVLATEIRQILKATSIKLFKNSIE